MAAMAPALTDAPAEARHIRMKLAAENNGNSTNLLLSSSVSPSSTVGSNGKRHHEDGCLHCRKSKESLPEPLNLGKLQPLVASYLCSHVAPVAEESVLIKPSLLKSCGLRNGGLLMRKALNRGHPKGLISEGGAGAGNGGGAMVPVNGLAKKAAVPCTALPEKGSVATVNGDSAKPPTSSEAFLRLSSKYSDMVSTVSASGDTKPQRQQDLVSHTLEARGVSSSATSWQNKSQVPPTVQPHSNMVAAHSHNKDGQNDSALSQSGLSQSVPTSTLGVERLSFPERAQQSRRRHVDVTARLHRLCKRLQVVQAKQIERHVKQQLTGFVHHATASPHSQEYMLQLLRGGTVHSELEHLHLNGTTSLRAAEAQFDSDATESSSGGESDVEEEELTRVDIEQRHVKLWRRAEGRFALDRASIISRWSWLQAHISDLEYRIRQHTDIYRQIRASKGTVELENPYPAGAIKAESQVSQNNHNPYSRTLSDTCVNGIFSSTSSSARVRPLTSCKRRRLIHPSTLQNVNIKGVCCSPTTQCEVNPLCVMCRGALPSPNPELQFQLPLVERVSLQDASIHPTLSLQSDMSLSVEFQNALKCQWQSKRIEKAKPFKKLPLAHKLYASSLSTSLKHKFRFSSSQMAAMRFASHKSRSVRLQKHQSEAGLRSPNHDIRTPCSADRLFNRGLRRKRVREDSPNRADYSELQTEESSLCPSQSSYQPSTPSITNRQMYLPSDSSTPLTTSNQTTPCSMLQPIRKRRCESSFDINNIVIPMSVAATTRVERLQYKEIITPSWRGVNVFSHPLADEDQDVEVEDMSDAAVAQRHQKCEEQERSRWRWTSLSPAKRRNRSYKSVDGQSLSGTNPSTPQPSSPDTGHFHMLQDYGPIPSPLSPPSPDMPCSRDAQTPNSRDSLPHTRETSRPVYNEDTRCSTPDFTFEERTVQPWERRNFPLSKDPVANPKVKPRPPQRFHSRAGSESEASTP